MSKQLQETITQFFTMLLHGLQTGTHFVAAQLPDIIRQLIAWNIAMQWLYIATYSLCVVFFLSYMAYGFRKSKTGQTGDTRVTFFVTALLSIPCSAGFFGAVVANVFTLVQLYIAPKVWLLNYVRQMLMPHHS